MDLLIKVALFVHLLSMASLLGGALVQVRDDVRVVNTAMLYGAYGLVGSGLLLVGFLEGDDYPLNHTKIGVKLAVALVVAVLCWVNRTREDVPRGLFDAMILLAVGNVAVAVFW